MKTNVWWNDDLFCNRYCNFGNFGVKSSAVSTWVVAGKGWQFLMSKKFNEESNETTFSSQKWVIFYGKENVSLELSSGIMQRLHQYTTNSFLKLTPHWWPGERKLWILSEISLVVLLKVDQEVKYCNIQLFRTDGAL